MMSIDLYFKKFKSILGILTGLVGAFPFGGKYLLQGIIPPVEIKFLLIYLLFFFAIVFVVYFLRDLGFWKKPWTTPLAMFILLLISFIGFLIFTYWSQKVTRSIFVKRLNKAVYVIVGTERSEFAEKNLPNRTDEEMLKHRGYTKEEIRRLWTPESISRAHLFINGSYFLMLLPIVTTFSVGVLKLCLDECSRPDPPKINRP